MLFDLREKEAGGGREKDGEEEKNIPLNAYTEISTAIARNGKNLSAEEKNKLIALILGTEF